MTIDQATAVQMTICSIVSLIICHLTCAGVNGLGASRP